MTIMKTRAGSQSRYLHTSRAASVCTGVGYAHLFLALLLLTCAPAAAVQPDEILKDQALEQRARHISAQLRCLVCQNQSIDDSNAPLARDLRLLVRERLKKGDSDDQVMGFIVARYGEFVLLRPTFALHNLVLWLTPLIGLIGGGLLAWRYIKGGGTAGDGLTDQPLTAEEQARVDEILKEN